MATNFNRQGMTKPKEWVNFAKAEKLLLRYLGLTFAWVIGFLIPYANVVIVPAVFLYQAKLVADAKILMNDKSGMAYVYGAASLIPFIGFFLVGIMHTGCRSSLEVYGVKSGLFGVSSAAIAKAEAKQSASSSPELQQSSSAVSEAFATPDLPSHGSGESAETQVDPELKIFEAIGRELESGSLDNGVWTKAFALSGGDDQKARATYINLRFDQIAKRSK